MFCYKCGSKLMEGALFCAQCGTKIAIDTGTVQIPIQNNTNNTDNRSSEVCNLLKKHLYSIVRTEEKLLLYPGDERKMNSFPSEIVTEYTNKKPLLIFDYMGEGLTSGFIITESTIAYVYGGYGCEYDLAEIESVEIGKAGLATTMVLLFNDNTKSSPLYMTSIRDPQKFINGFNELLFELNQPELYQKRQEMLGSKDMGTILTLSCSPYVGEYTYCAIGAPIKASYSKHAAAIKNFNMSSADNIYIIYDETIFGTCKKGFAICEQGIFYNQSKGSGHIKWEEFSSFNISKGTSLEFGNFSFATIGKDAKIMFEILSKIIELLN